jgi:hypothetical protein
MLDFYIVPQSTVYETQRRARIMPSLKITDARMPVDAMISIVFEDEEDKFTRWFNRDDN